MIAIIVFLFATALSMDSCLCKMVITSDLSGEHDRIICYFTNWASYRPKYGKIFPSDIDPSLCTNILYAFVFLNATTLELQSSDPFVDFHQNFYRNVASLASKKTKVSLSLGGASDSKGTKYSEMMNDKKNRTKFIISTVNYIEKYGFQGFDIDIEFPACPRGNCTAGNPKDKEGFAALIEELHLVFKPRGWVLSAAISASSTIIDAAYDIQALNKYLDWIGIMNYDYHSFRDGMTGPNSPLFSHHGDPTPNFNMNATIQHLLQIGALPSKLVIGLPFYSRTFTLKNENQHGYWAPTKGPGKKGQYTFATGVLAYYEVCDFIRNDNWTTVEDSALGSYVFKEDQWATYLSLDDMEYRINYAKENNLGGAMIWELSFDDFRGAFCDQGKYPLLYHVNKLFGLNKI